MYIVICVVSFVRPSDHSRARTFVQCALILLLLLLLLLVLLLLLKYFPLRPPKTHAIRKQMVHTYTHQKWSSFQRYSENKKVDALDVFRTAYNTIQYICMRQIRIQNHKHTVNERWTNGRTNAKRSEAKAIDAMHWWNVAASYHSKYNCTIQSYSYRWCVNSVYTTLLDFKRLKFRYELFLISLNFVWVTTCSV